MVLAGATSLFATRRPKGRAYWSTGTSRAAGASALLPRPTTRRSPPDRRRLDARQRVARAEQPGGRHRAGTRAGYSRASADAISTPTRTGRSAVAIGDDHEDALALLVRVLARGRREAHRIEADRPGSRARSARPPAARRRSTARRSARTACRSRGRPRCSCPRSRRCPGRASPGSGSACSATG